MTAYEIRAILVCIVIIAICFYIAAKPEKPARRKRIHGRRQLLIAELLPHKYLDHYELSRRTGIPFKDVSKLMATAFKAGDPVERIKKQVIVPESAGLLKNHETVWCYRIKRTQTALGMVSPNVTMNKLEEQIETKHRSFWEGMPEEQRISA
jgi:hypothetical protein